MLFKDIKNKINNPRFIIKALFMNKALIIHLGIDRIKYHNSCTVHGGIARIKVLINQ